MSELSKINEIINLIEFFKPGLSDTKLLDLVRSELHKKEIYKVDLAQQKLYIKYYTNPTELQQASVKLYDIIFELMVKCDPSIID